MKNSIRQTLFTALAAMLAAPNVEAAPYTWTSTATGTLDWTTPGNWDASTPYVSGASNELIIFSDITTNIAAGARSITSNVPATLSMNTLTLNGKGASSGASSSNITIGSGASTWTIGDGTTSTVNLNGNFGATGAANIFYNVAAHLTLNQATTLFAGNGTAGVFNGANDPGFVFSGNIGEAAAGYGITKSGSSRLTLSGGSLTFTGPMTVNSGSLFLTGNSNPGFAMTVNTGAILRIGNNTATQIGTSGNYAGNISTGTGGTLQLWSTSAQEYSGIISGSGGIHKAYSGTLTLSGNNTYTGKTQFIPQTASSFTVNVSSFDYVTSGDWANHGLGSSLGAPTTVANGTIDVGSGAAQANVTLNYTGAGETTDRVLNISFNGTANQTISASGSGLLKFTSAPTMNLSSGSRALILTGTGSGEFTQRLPQLTAGGLEKQGAGTWTLGGSGLFTGPTKITAGTLSLSSATALQNSRFDTTSVAGSASAGLKIATPSLSLGGLTGSNSFESRFNTTSSVLYSGLTTLTFNTLANTTMAYSGGLADNGNGMTLTMNGGGTQLLNGTNAYTGLTTVNGGTLGSGTGFSGAVTAATGGILSPGASAGAVGTLAISNASASALTLNGGNLLMEVSTASSDLIAVTGTTVLNGTNTVFLNPTTGVAAGTYNLVNSAATTGSGSVVFANGSTTLGDATLAVSAGNIQMTVGAGGLNHSVWVGTTGTWDSGTNWNRNGTPASAFVAGDWVTIDDTGSNAATITSATPVSPAQLTFNNSAKDFVVTATIGGTGTPLVKMGTRTATLGSSTVFPANSYTGGTVVLGGILNLTGASNTNVNYLLGDAAGGIALNGGQLRASSTNVSGARSVAVLGGGGTLYVNKNNSFTTSGILTGSGTLNLLDPGGNGTLATYNFNSTANDFTGGLVLNNAIMNIGRLADSANNIVINSNTSSATGNVNSTPGLKYNSGATSPLTLSGRAIEFSSAVTSAILIQNNNTTHAITVSSDLVASGAGTKTLMLDAAGGAGSPTNVFSGDITDGTGGGTVGVVKPSSTGAASNASTSTWVLSGNNSYTGPTAINTGTLAGIGANAFGNTSGISIAAAGILSLRGDSSTTFASSNVTTSASGATINVNQATIAGTGAKTMTIGAIGTSSTAASYQVNFTGANNTSLSVGAVTGAASTAAGTVTINNTIASAGTLTLASYQSANTSGGETLIFSGTGNTSVTGTITPSSTTLALTKNGSGTTTLSSNNAYSGVTTVSAGVLRLNHANALPGGIGAAGGTSALTFSGGVIGLGAGDFTRNLAAAGTVTGVNFTGAGGWAAYGADRVVNLNNDSHPIVWATANTGLNGQTLILGAATATHAVDFQNPIDLGTATRTVQVDHNGVDSVDATMSGVLSGGTNGALTKTGGGTLQLTAANSYTGTTTVSGGTLVVTGASGALATSSRTTIASGATLEISNTSALNSGNRLNNAATVTMTGGTLRFSHTGGAADYSETTGTFAVTSGGGNKIIASQADATRTSILTLGGLSISPGATLTFEGNGLGLDDRNQIFIAGRSAGTIADALYFDALNNVAAPATYDLVNGVGPATFNANVTVLGGTIPSGSNLVSIVPGGTPGNIVLSSADTNVQSITQNGNEPGTVSFSGQTLRTAQVIIGNSNSPLTLGTSPGSGTLTPKTSGGSLTLSNSFSGPLLLVNAVIADNGTASSLNKSGAGTVQITAGATYTGATTVDAGPLTLTGAGSLPDTSAVNLAGSTALLHLSGISATSETIGPLTGLSGSQVVLGGKNLALNAGTPATFAGVISGSGGSLTLLPGASQTLSGDNTFTGGVTIGAGGTLSVNKIENSGAQPLGQGTTPIVMQGNIGSGSTLTYTGAGAGSTNRGLNLTGGQGGTVNVTAGALTVNGTLSGSTNFHKAGAGTMVLSGASSWNADGFVNEGTMVLGTESGTGSNSLSAGNWTVATGATMRLNTTGALETSTLTRNGTYNLEAGTLRTNSIAGSGAFVWGAGTITPLSNLTEGSTDRTDPGGSPSGPVVREGTILDFSGNLASSNGSVLDLGGLFTDNGLRYNQIDVSGSLSLAAADELKISINPYLLRPNTYTSTITGDWGTMRLVIADAITGAFDTISGIGTDHIGFAADPGSGSTDTFFDPASLAMNTYYIEYRTSGVLSGAAVLFHYKVAGSVPEPGSAGLLLGGVILLRAMRRVAGRASFVRKPGDGRSSGLRRRRSRRTSLHY